MKVDAIVLVIVYAILIAVSYSVDTWL